MLPNSYASRAARRLNRPIVITAHGALEPWALQNSGWKKQLVGRWFQFQDLKTATCLHVNSEAEQRSLRQLGMANPIAIIPNGVNLGEWNHLPPVDLFTDRFPQLAGKQLFLFMARIHRKKGLQHLLEGWSRVSPLNRNWHLVIAGPDDGFLEASQKLVADLNVASTTSFVGALHGDQKRSALAAASAFVQPSFSEGFSMSIVEAMACRLPVVITPGCNFSEASHAGAAIEVQPTADSTAQGLEAIIQMSISNRQAMGERGRRMVEREYTWDQIAAKTIELYHWMATASDQPDFVTYE